MKRPSDRFRWFNARAPGTFCVAAVLAEINSTKPVLEQIATERADQLKIGKLNIDDNLGTQARFDVMSIPTLILFKGGEPILRLVGAKGKGQLLEELDRYL